MRMLTVSQFIAAINEVIYTEEVAVEGEVSGFAVRNGKWAFFSLKEEEAALECFAIAFHLTQPIADGMRVRVYGYPNVYPQSGRFRFVVRRVELVGEGTLKQAFDALKKKLQSEGLFAPERKRLLPRFPRAIGLITSRDAAAYTDFMRILTNRWSGVTVCFYDVRVQGPEAMGEMVRAFEFFNGLHEKGAQLPSSRAFPGDKPRALPRAGREPIIPDILVLVRGGGSLEDLAAFNSEEVARAIFSSKIPVVVGVGHERDETIADYAADVRASTPSNASELVVPDRREILSELSFRVSQVEQAMRHELMVRHHVVRDALRTIERAIMTTVHQSRALFVHFEHAFTKFEDRVRRDQSFIESQERLLVGLDPQRLLRRGYSITFDALGRVVKSSAQVDIGEEVGIHLGRGTVKGKVTEKDRERST